MRFLIILLTFACIIALIKADDSAAPPSESGGDAKPPEGGDAKPAEGGDAKKDDAKPAEGGDAKPAEGGDAKPAEGGDAKKDDAKPAEGGDAKPAEGSDTKKDDAKKDDKASSKSSDKGKAHSKDKKAKAKVTFGDNIDNESGDKVHIRANDAADSLVTVRTDGATISIGSGALKNNAKDISSKGSEYTPNVIINAVTGDKNGSGADSGLADEGMASESSFGGDLSSEEADEEETIMRLKEAIRRKRRRMHRLRKLRMKAMRGKHHISR